MAKANYLAPYSHEYYLNDKIVKDIRIYLHVYRYSNKRVYKCNLINLYNT